MNRSELIHRLADRFPALSHADSDTCVNAILDRVAAALASGNRVEIRGFGSFDLNVRRPRIGRNPLTGEAVQVPAKHVPHFKAGMELRGRVNRVTSRQ